MFLFLFISIFVLGGCEHKDYPNLNDFPPRPEFSPPHKILSQFNTLEKNRDQVDSEVTSRLKESQDGTSP